jgi:hypothetical protein
MIGGQGDFMTSRDKATRKYQKKCDAIVIRPLKEKGTEYRSAAKQAGKTMSGLIFELLDAYIAEHPPEREEGKDNDD